MIARRLDSRSRKRHGHSLRNCNRAPISSMNCPAYRRPRISPSVVIPPISSLADRAPNRPRIFCPCNRSKVRSTTTNPRCSLSIRITIRITGRRRKIVHCEKTDHRRSGASDGYPSHELSVDWALPRASGKQRRDVAGLDFVPVGDGDPGVNAIVRASTINFGHVCATTNLWSLEFQR